MVVATTVSVDKSYTLGSLVVVKGDCEGNSVGVGLQLQLNGNTIWFGQVSSIGKGFTSSFDNLQKGNYAVSAACNNENSAKKSFCVGSNADCGIVVGGGDQSGSSSSSSSGSSSSGGGGGSCSPQWDCEVWTQCNTTLQQSRICYDSNKCKKPSVENRTCAPCLESWVCSEWSACDNGGQIRTCEDEHNCGTGVSVPKEKKLCDDTQDYGYFPASTGGNEGGDTSSSVSSTSEDVSASTSTTSTTQKKPVVEAKKDYTFYYIGIPSLLILLIVLFIVLYHFFHKPKHVVMNLNDLKEWVRKEKEAGSSIDDIRSILSQHTGWSEDELQMAFGELSSDAVKVDTAQKADTVKNNNISTSDDLSHK